jgi:hypothetical protein
MGYTTPKQKPDLDDLISNFCIAIIGIAAVAAFIYYLW